MSRGRIAWPAVGPGARKLLARRQLDRHVRGGADHLRAAVGVSLLTLDQRFQIQKEFLGKHFEDPFQKDRLSNRTRLYWRRGVNQRSEAKRALRISVR